MEQPPDSRGTVAFPSANQKKPDQIPAAPGPVADEPTGRPIPPFTGKIPLPQRPPNSSGPISKPGKRSAAPGEIPLPQLPLSGDKGLSAPQSPQAGTGKIPIFALTGKMPAAQAAFVKRIVRRGDQKHAACAAAIFWRCSSKAAIVITPAQGV